MSLTRVDSFLVHPSKGIDDQPQIGGTQVPKGDELYRMLADVFDRAPAECEIEIVFRPNDAGEQRNACRDALARYAGQPTVTNGRAVALRLQEVTTNRSGLGLLFLMAGKVGKQTRLVVSRFPADQGVIAEEKQGQLSVEFIERVFMKSAKAYKSAVYQSDSVQRGFWDGRAIDRQIRGPKELSDYWIHDFLDSDLRTTGPAGTKRIAVALRSATRRAEPLEVRQELISAAGLLRGQDGRAVSGRSLVTDLGLSTQATEALEKELQTPELMDEVFTFDRAEFERHALYRAVALDNGGLMIAEDDEFDDVFKREVLDGSSDGLLMRYTTQGHITDENLRKTK